MFDLFLERPVGRLQRPPPLGIGMIGVELNTVVRIDGKNPGTCLIAVDHLQFEIASHACLIEREGS